MRQVFLENGVLAVHNVAQPVIQDRFVMVSVHYSFISSGTEAATLANATHTSVFNNFPQKIKAVLESLKQNGVESTKALIRGRLMGNLTPLGYSCSGKVIAVGKEVTKFRPGDYVACAGAGFASHADVVCVPENLVVAIPDEAHVKHASITTIGSIALQGVRRAQVQLDETVVVIGLGLLGQITVELLKHAGCRVIGIDPVAERGALAKQLGADQVFTDMQEAKTSLEFMTSHHGADCTIITAATSSSQVVQDAMLYTRRKGRVVVVGDVGLHVQRDPFYKKEIDFLISCSYGPGRYDTNYEIEGQDYPYEYVRWTENRNMQTIVNLIQHKKLSVGKLITQEFSVDDVEKAYEEIKARRALGVILKYVPKSDISFIPAVKKPFKPKNVTFPAFSKKNEIRVGFIGAGGFAQVKLLPIVAKVKGVKISAIVDTSIATAINTSRTYGAALSLVNDTELFEKDVVDAVVIASPHIYHCDQIIEALGSGKAVFVEKPMVTTFDQHERLTAFLKHNPTSPFCVDYNRSFSPFMQKIKGELSNRKSPVMIHYRMNSGYIPGSHWVQTDMGAGRLIGEACHIFDLFCFLTGSEPAAVSAEAIKPLTDNIFPTDNFCVQISFKDGSVCSLMYTALGHNGLSKEYMEVFYDGKAIVMDDYRKLSGFGVSHSFNETMALQDKGHHALLNKFFNNLRSEKGGMPISLDRLSIVSELTLTIDKLVCQGGGEKQFE